MKPLTMTTLAVVLGTGPMLTAQDEDHVVPTHPLEGHVLDTAGDGVPGALVVLCDGATGIPMRTDATLRMTQGKGDPDEVATATCDAEGRFQFEELPVGTYRLVAQTWPQAEAVEGVFEKNGPEVHLRGAVSGVAVPRASKQPLEIRPFGTATLIVQQQVEKDSHSLILVSPKPLAADPVLMFASWSGPFLQQLYGGSRTHRGRVVFRGLPAGTAHLALFTNDNNPGTGGIPVEVLADQEVTVEIPVIASWSNGVKTPPDRLKPLVQKMGALDKEAARAVQLQLDEDLFEIRSGGLAEAFARQIAVFDKEVVFADGTKVRGADLLAAIAYLRLQR